MEVSALPPPAIREGAVRMLKDPKSLAGSIFGVTFLSAIEPLIAFRWLKHKVEFSWRFIIIQSC